MQNAPKLLELLAPAQNADMGITAINFGADAVYIGAPRFSARAAASNPVSEIARLAKYAHGYHAKVYVAFNTVLYDHELEEARNMIFSLADAEIDALIIQDMGILEMDIPPIALHASTQVNNDEPLKIGFLENAGFSRVILARELTMEQISRIRQKTSVELEAFVHGALCVSVSGHCYMSLAAGGRSGNRGVCAQPCRLTYDLEDAEGKRLVTQKHLLSLKDLDLSDHLLQMADAGISSFKIEGRLKDENYVKNITSWYRKRLDNIILGRSDFKKSSSGVIYFDFEADPAKTFSRGTSSYFLEGRQKEITSIDTPKSAGEKIGKVLKASGNRIEIESLHPIHNNDGLTWFGSNGELKGVKVNVADGNRLMLAGATDLSPGTLIYRNFDHQFLEKLKSSRTIRKIRLSLDVAEVPDGLKFTAVDEDNVQLELIFTMDKIIAKQPEPAKQLLADQLMKTGGTAFEIASVSIEWETPLFLPASVVNRFRREFLDAFMEKRVQIWVPEQRVPALPNTKWPCGKLSYYDNVTNRLAGQFYAKYGADPGDPSIELTRDFLGKRLMTMKHCLKYQAGYCPRETGSKESGWKEPLHLVDGSRKFRVEFDCKACRMNLYEL